jgi:hypothetical protein
MISKLWALQQSSFTEQDAIWCRGLGVEYTAEPLFKTAYAYGKRSSEFLIGWRIRLTTHTLKQEDMLMLKYGSSLQLVHSISSESLNDSDIHQ